MDEIVTPRLRLRRALPSDLEAMHAVLAHPVATRYWSRLPHASIDLTRAWLAGMIASPPDVSDDFVIEHEGRVIGKAGFYRIPEIGFILHPDSWRRGFSAEALAAVIPRAFARFTIDAIVADVDPRNVSALALLEKLGFVRTGYAERTFQLGEEWCDSVYLTLTRPSM